MTIKTTIQLRTGKPIVGTPLQTIFNNGFSGDWRILKKRLTQLTTIKISNWDKTKYIKGTITSFEKIETGFNQGKYIRRNCSSK